MTPAQALAVHPDWTAFDGMLVGAGDRRCVYSAVRWTGLLDVFAAQDDPGEFRFVERIPHPGPGATPVLDDPANHGILLHYLREVRPEIALTISPGGCSIRAGGWEDAGPELGELLARAVLDAWGAHPKPQEKP